MVTDLVGIAKEILKTFPLERVFAFEGDLGAGKTAFIKAFCQVLGVKQAVVSPTFSLVNEYLDEHSNPVYHFDFYRIKKLEEVLDIGYEEYLYSGEYCFLEWADQIRELLPLDHVYITVGKQENTEERIIEVMEIRH